MGRTAVPDDFRGEQQSLSPVVAGEAVRVRRQRVQGREIVAMEVVVDRRRNPPPCVRVLVGCRAQFGTFLSGEDGRNIIEIHRTERAALIQQNIFGFQVPVRPVAFEKFQRQAVELSGQVAEVRFVAGAGAPHNGFVERDSFDPVVHDRRTTSPCPSACQT